MVPTTQLPSDAALPGLTAIGAAGLAAAIPGLGLEGVASELILRSHKPGLRATLEVRAPGLHFAFKTYAKDPAPEATLYQVLAGAGLAGDSGVRTPALLAWERDLRVLAISWLTGPSVEQLIEDGQGERAGELAARWLQRAASLPVRLGPPRGAAGVLQQAGKWVAALAAADPSLGAAGTAVTATLARTQPDDGTPGLVHCRLYARHVLDLGDGVGLIDWQRFGQGPAEIDAGMFLATVSRLKRKHEPAAAQAEEAFLTGSAGLLDERALAWHQAAALLHLSERACKPTVRRKGDWLLRAHALVIEAARLADAAGSRSLGGEAAARLARHIRAAAAQGGPPVSPAPLADRLATALCAFKGWTLELVLHALSTTRATPQELEQIRKLLDEKARGPA